MTGHTCRFRLRFHHMDRAGMVFHGAYVELFQDAFEEMMRASGHVEKDLENELGVRLPVVAHAMSFPAPPTGDLIEVEMAIGELGESSVRFDGTATDEKGVVCASATVTRVCIGADGRPTPLPEPLREAWARFVKA